MYVVLISETPWRLLSGGPPHIILVSVYYTLWWMLLGKLGIEGAKRDKHRKCAALRWNFGGHGRTKWGAKKLQRWAHFLPLKWYRIDQDLPTLRALILVWEQAWLLLQRSPAYNLWWHTLRQPQHNNSPNSLQEWAWTQRRNHGIPDSSISANSSLEWRVWYDSANPSVRSYRKLKSESSICLLSIFGKLFADVEWV